MVPLGLAVGPALVCTAVFLLLLGRALADLFFRLLVEIDEVDDVELELDEYEDEESVPAFRAFLRTCMPFYFRGASRGTSSRYCSLRHGSVPPRPSLSARLAGA